MLPSLSRIIARDVAIGIPLHDIASLRGIPLEELQKLTSGSIFQKAVSDLQTKLDEQLVADEAEDPIRILLRSKAKDSAVRLGEEVNNFEEETGGSASTRIKASTAILDMAGYGKQEATGNNLAVIMLSPEKLKAIHTIDAAALESIPDSVNG